MPQPVKIGKKTRMSYAKIKEVAQMPHLLEIQNNSYKWFIEEGLKEVEFDYNGRTIHAAVVSGLGNADALMKKIQKGEVHYDFVEVMACRRGCIMGGGQPVPAGPRSRIARSKGLYDTDINTQIKKSNENPLILSLYDELLKGKTHELLHRNFEAAKK